MTQGHWDRAGRPEPRVRRRVGIAGWVGIAVCAVFGAAVFVPRAPAGAQGAPVPKVGVVDFYAPTPLAVYNGTAPQQVAADDLAGLLARAGGDRIAVVPRRSVLRAQLAMRWQNQDVLDFKRLGALASAIGADRLVLGWIPILAVGGNGNLPVPDGTGAALAQASLVVQVFDPADDRILGETRVYGTAIGGIQYQLVASVLDDALRHAVTPVLNLLTPPPS